MTQSTDNTLRIYFYSSWNSQTKNGGWSFLMTRFSPEGKLERSGFSDKGVATTQQRMELTALVEAFKRIEERTLTDRPITVYTSSKSIHNSITKWLEGWKAKGWKGGDKKPIKDLELWQRLDTYNDQFKPSWELINNEGEHPAHVEAKTMAQAIAGKAKGF